LKRPLNAVPYEKFKDDWVLVVEIAKYFGINGSSISLSIRKGEELSNEKRFSKSIISLRP